MSLPIGKKILDFSLDTKLYSVMLDLEKLFNEYLDSFYLFGSTSKGTRKEDSDIDLLLIVPNVRFSGIEARRFKRNYTRSLFDLLSKYKIDFDLKVYGEFDFNEACGCNFFEKDICKDLILVKDVVRLYG